MLLDGKVLVTGGDESTSQPTATANPIDPETNQFTAVGPMSTARTLHFAVLMSDGSVIVGAGETVGGSATATVERYNPGSRTFSPLPSMPLADARRPTVFLGP
jgi:hypothetical protein